MKNEFTFDEWFEEREYQYKAGFRTGLAMGLSICSLLFTLVKAVA